MTTITEARLRSIDTFWHEARAMLALAWPMVLTNLAQTAMTATDVMMMGWIGPNALAAGALGSNLYYTPMFFGMGLILATSPMLARELGANRHSVREIRRTVRQGLWVALFVSVPLWFMLWHAEAILLLMGQRPDLAHQAGRYMQTLQWSLFPFYGYIVLRSFISAFERPGWAMIVVTFAVPFNALANWCLMFGKLGFPALGVVGSGLATTLSSSLMFTGLAIVVLREKQFRRYRLFGRFWRSDWPRFRQILRLGLPIAAIIVFEVSVFNGAALLMGLIGASSLAAHAIAIQICSLTFMVPLGFGQAATVRVGRFLGAGNKEGVRRAGWTAYALGIGFMMLAALVMVLVPRLLISAFIDVHAPQNAEVIAHAVTFLAFAALFQIADGAQAVGSGMLRGLHDTTIPMIYAAIGYWGIGVPLGIYLAFWMGLNGAGIWMGLFIGLAIVAALLLWRWVTRGKWAPAELS
ncbi:MATE family efflux transporter [Phyllobacterium phragmitis]|uniref:Multidrug-efflux transporter n=1 Tax=Phyllobacterium phragmitis TaxID=2670329 RepID=A0A2S9IXK2_9HYPH|nr:MATE family efflux transporter [Phyllobacterium phragmitis]PRD45228.1 MATE family efflux transporter [Phyllobacterium phragmitis]